MSDSRMGNIELICGCMFSGKTEQLVERLKAAARAGLSARAFKHSSDVRYATFQLVSHSGYSWDATPVSSAMEILGLAETAQVVVIDEAQFFGDDVIETCRVLAAQGRHVVVGALDRDSWGEPFGPIPALAQVANRVTRTRGRCECGAEAEFTQRLTPVGEQTMIGGPEAYAARCARCFQPPPAELRR